MMSSPSRSRSSASQWVIIAVPQVDDRLHVQLEVVVSERVADDMLARAVQLVAYPAAIEGCSTVTRLRPFSLLWYMARSTSASTSSDAHLDAVEDHDTDAGGDPDRPAVDLHLVVAYRAEQLLGQLACLLGVGVDDHDAELVAAEARQHVGRPQATLQDLRDRGDQIVTRPCGRRSR